MAEIQGEKSSKSFGDRVRDWLLLDLRLKLLAILVVVVIWFSVGGQTRPAAPIKLHGIDVTLDRVPKQYSVTSTDPTEVTLTVEGPEDLLRELRIATATRSSDLVARADLSSLQQGVQMARLSVTGLTDGLTLKGIEPDSVRVFLDPIVQKDVRVVPRFAGSPPDGYKFTGAKTEPEFVTLSGPSTLLDKITEVSTTTISLARTASFDDPVDLDITGNDIMVTGRPVLHVTIAEDFGTRTLKVPVTVMGADGVADPGEVTVTLRGALPVLNALRPADLVARVMVSAGKQAFPVEVTFVMPPATPVEVVTVAPQSVRLRK